MKTSFEDEHEGLYQPRLWSNLHLWREILFNACPNAKCELFKDGQGQTHWLKIDHSETGATLAVYYRGGKVARAVLEWSGPDEVILNDLFVASSCRNRGIATCILDRAISLARQHGAKCIAGRIIRKDAEQNLALLDWYRRRSFKIEPVSATPPIGPVRPLSKVAQQSQLHFETVATIRLDLL